MTYIETSLEIPLNSILNHLQNRIVNETSYFGVKTLKNPMDFWVYQEILFESKPDYIIEIGNFSGGSALALAHFCDALDTGHVIAIDIDHHRIPDIVRNHPRITLLEGDACEQINRVKEIIGHSSRVTVIEDSSHTYENTLNVLQTYSGLVGQGMYFIVEDSICHHGLDLGPTPGPYEAIETFMENNTSFEVDRSRESFLITWNPKGYLKKN